MVSKSDLRTTDGCIIGLTQRSVCSGVVRTQILRHLSLRLLEAQRSVAWLSGRATLEPCQNLKRSHTQTPFTSAWCYSILLLLLSWSETFFDSDN